ncbi:MAG: terminase family protein [Flavobacteriales bacterium]|nr:terminase family protein [Flavobacteriales bacterium]
MASKIADEIKEAAKLLYLKKWTPKEIKNQLNLNSERVVYQWAAKYSWASMLQHETVEQAISRRLVLLAEKEELTENDLKIMDRLMGQLDKIANIDLKKARILKEKARTQRELDGIESGGGNKPGKRKKSNDISGITKEQLEKVRLDLFYGYQQRWHDNLLERIRFILKSRQIGATYYFAYEAFENAVLTGDNQVFLSASRNQSNIFKAYIIKFAREYFGVELKGEVITLSNGAELRFVSTNARTAQGFNGHLYIDEVFWIANFKQINDLAGGMASHKKWRKTYFSTPSIKSHGAFPLWSGQKYNDDKGKEYEFDLSHASLKHGVKGKDNIWRNVVTVVDAQEQGCDLFDIDTLKDENSESTFNNLFMCHFLEAGLSVFNLNDLLACAVDSNVVWVDFKKKEQRPFGNKHVWLGYDPARHGDKSTLVVLAPPDPENPKFRLLEKMQLKGSFQFQANTIEKLFDRYNVQFLGIDCTGVGLGVFELVQAFYRRATPIHYGIESKTNLVLKAIDVIESRRMQWDEEHTDMAPAFLQVQQTTTGQDKITYVADRTSELGHADVAFAMMHAMSNEPLNRKQRKVSLGIAS